MFYIIFFKELLIIMNLKWRCPQKKSNIVYSQLYKEHPHHRQVILSSLLEFIYPNQPHSALEWWPSTAGHLRVYIPYQFPQSNTWCLFFDPYFHMSRNPVSFVSKWGDKISLSIHLKYWHIYIDIIDTFI